MNSSGTEAINYIHELLNCCELNMDDMESQTVELIDEIRNWLDGTATPASR